MTVATHSKPADHGSPSHQRVHHDSNHRRQRRRARPDTGRSRQPINWTWLAFAIFIAAIIWFVATAQRYGWWDLLQLWRQNGSVVHAHWHDFWLGLVQNLPLVPLLAVILTGGIWLILLTGGKTNEN